MTVLLDRAPFSETPDELIVRGERVPVRANQIIAWVSLTLQRTLEPGHRLQPFPAIVDTGSTQSFSLQQRHLIDWAGIRPEALRTLGAVRDRERGLHILRRQVNLWMHSNQCGQRDHLSNRLPQRLTTEEGIVVILTKASRDFRCLGCQRLLKMASS